MAGPITLSLANVRGHEVTRWLDGTHRGKGSHVETLDVGALPAGTYLLRLEAPDGTVRATKLQVHAP